MQMIYFRLRVIRATYVTHSTQYSIIINNIYWFYNLFYDFKKRYLFILKQYVMINRFSWF